MSDACTWCGAAVTEGYRVSRGAGCATFCRLEHVVPWVIRGAAWEPAGETAGGEEHTERCAVCGIALGADRIDVVRMRGEHRIADGLCSAEHLLDWAKAGGRYATHRAG